MIDVMRLKKLQGDYAAFAFPTFLLLYCSSLFSSGCFYKLMVVSTSLWLVLVSMLVL